MPGTELDTGAGGLFYSPLWLSGSLGLGLYVKFRLYQGLYQGLYPETSPGGDLEEERVDGMVEFQWGTSFLIYINMTAIFPSLDCYVN